MEKKGLVKKISGRPKMAKEMFDFLQMARSEQKVVQEEAVVETEPLSLEEIYYARTYTFRLDTLIMAGIVGVMLLCIAFYLGRLSVGEPVKAKQIVVVPPSLSVPSKSTSNKKSRVAAKRTPKKEPLSSQASSQRKKKLQTTQPSPYELQLLTTPSQEGAKEVVAFLQEKGWQPILKRRGRFWLVRLGGFRQKDTQVLQKVRDLRFKGKQCFRSAYFVKVH